MSATELRALAARLDADGDELGVADDLRALADRQDPAVGEMLPIPVSAARDIAEAYGFDQVIICARRVGDAPDPYGEHVTTYGRSAEHCGVAARVGNFLKHRIIGWPEHEVPPAHLPVIDEAGIQRAVVEYSRSLQRGYKKSVALTNALRAARGDAGGDGLMVCSVDDVEAVRALLSLHRYRFQVEVDLHQAIADVLTGAAIAFEREKPLGRRDRLDFYLPESGIAIEVKVRGAMQPAVRQIDRYVRHDEVQGVVLAASRSWASRGYPVGPFSLQVPKPLAIAYLARPI